MSTLDCQFFITAIIVVPTPENKTTGNLRFAFSATVRGRHGVKMTMYRNRPRQVIGLIYTLVYLSIFFAYATISREGYAWEIESTFSLMVAFWFLLSLAVKLSMVMNRSIELLNLSAMVAFMSIGFAYYPQPGHAGGIESFCYDLNIAGGSVVDLCDFVYQGAANKDTRKNS